jgi:hypothetical protein
MRLAKKSIKLTHGYLWYQRLAVTFDGKVYLREVFPAFKGPHSNIFEGL